MSQDETVNPKTQVETYISENTTFDANQEVETKSWYLPTRTVENLREYIIGEYGTTKHIGAFATRAMLNWMQENPTDTTHQTWSQLKNDYNYSDLSVTKWNYRNYVDYTEMGKDKKTALGFSAPVSVVKDFTSNLTKNEYGSELANAVEAELLKRSQIAQMRASLTNDDATRTSEDTSTQETVKKVEVDETGDREDLSTITVEDAVTISQAEVVEFAENNDIGWKNRRGLLAAIVRHRTFTPKKLIYGIDEYAFEVDKSRSKRKDLNALLDRAEDESDPLCIAPAKQVMDEMGVYNLQQSAGLTNRRQPLSFDGYSPFQEFDQFFYNNEKISGTEMWAEFGEAVAEIAYQLSEVEWNVGDSVMQVYKGIHYRNALEKYLPFVRTVKKLIEQENDDIEDLTAISNRIASNIEFLEERLQEVGRKGSNGNSSLDERYERFKSEGETPTSIEFSTKGRLKQRQTLEL